MKDKRFSVEVKGDLTKKAIDKKTAQSLIEKSFANYNHMDPMKYFAKKSEFEIYKASLYNLMHSAIPIEVIKGCKSCQENNEGEEQACTNYIHGMELTLAFAFIEFDSILKSNSTILHTPDTKDSLIKKFYHCFYSVNGKGKVYFNLSKLINFCVDEGLRELSRQFNKDDTLKSLQRINESINQLNEKITHFKLYKIDDDFRYDVQKDFLKEKQEYLRNKDEYKSINKALSQLKISVKSYTLFIYYLQEGGYKPHFENHPEGIEFAIKELVKESTVTRSWKNFQIEYNRIKKYKSNRVGRDNEEHLRAAIRLLSPYPKSEAIAQQELNILISNNR